MRKIVLLLGVAALLAGAWVILGSVGSDVLPVGSADDAPAHGLEINPSLIGEGVAEGAPSEGTEPATERTVVETAEPNATVEPKQIRILVTQKESGEPAPGAAVTFLSTNALFINSMSTQKMMELQRLVADWEKLTDLYGTKVFANSGGVVFVPAEKKDMMFYVVGRKGDSYGQLGIDLRKEGKEENSEWQLELEEDLSIVVQVLDSLGRPAVGVPLGIHPERREKDPFELDQFFYRDLTQSEPPEGLARISHLQLLNQDQQKKGVDSSVYVLQARIPGLSDDGPIFDGENPPKDPIVLRLPPTGSVVVMTTDAEGRSLVPDSGMIDFVLVPEPPPEDLAKYMPPPSQRWNRPSKVDGTTVIDWVVTGKSYLARAMLSREFVVEMFPGPTRIEEEMRVTLARKAKSYNLIGRMLDERKNPVSKVRLRATYQAVGGSRRSRTFNTDDEGRFTVVVGSDGEPITLESLLIMYMTNVGLANNSTEMYSMQGLMPLVLGNNDLGDLVLRESPLVATGRVLVDGQIPKDDPFDLHVSRLQVVESQTQDTEGWRSERGMVLKFSEGGRFEIRGKRESARYRITMSWNPISADGGWFGYLPLDPVEFTPGSEDVTIDLHSGGSLQAVVLMDDIAKLKNLWLRLVRTGGEVEEEDATNPEQALPISWRRLYGTYKGHEEGQHRYNWRSLGPGMFRLEIVPRGAKVPLLTIENIQVRGGDSNDDPRLESIDLRRKVRRIEITVQDSAGRRIYTSGYGFPVVLINDQTLDGEVHGYSAVNGIATIITAEQSLDLLVVAEGYASAELHGVSEDSTITLESFPTVVIKTVGGLGALPAGHELQVSLSKKGRLRDQRQLLSDFSWGDRDLESWLRPASSGEALDGKGEVTIQVSGDGSYSLTVSVHSEASGNSAEIKAIEPSTIEVRTSAGPQVFEVSIADESLKQAVKQAAKTR